MVYSFFLHKISKAPDVEYSPMINIPRKHFGLRGEAAGAFASAGIDVNMVPFADEIDLKRCCLKIRGF